MYSELAFGSYARIMVPPTSFQGVGNENVSAKYDFFQPVFLGNEQIYQRLTLVSLDFLLVLSTTVACRLIQSILAFCPNLFHLTVLLVLSV